MQSLRPSRAWFLCFLMTALLFTTAAAGWTGREFTGYFDVSGVQEQGGLVQVTLHLKLFNHSEVNARSVIVALMGSGPAPMLRGNFQPVKVWKSRQFIEMSQEFTVTKEEFREWMQPPAQPNVIILFQDGNGKSWQQGAQISRRQLVAER